MKSSPRNTAMYPVLKRYLEARLAESGLIREDRMKALNELAYYVAARVGSGESVRLVFICTHNSRRSQMAQIWAQTAARLFGVPEVAVFSGGTEVTAFDPRAVSAMVRAGFRAERRSKEANPVYLVRAGHELPPVRAFSKAYHDPSIPRQGFGAVLTCSTANRECPVIPSVDRRVLVPYEDPKSANGTDREEEVYDERCREICREMVWLFARAAGADSTTGRRSSRKST